MLMLKLSSMCYLSIEQVFIFLCILLNVITDTKMSKLNVYTTSNQSTNNNQLNNHQS